MFASNFGFSHRFLFSKFGAETNSTFKKIVSNSDFYDMFLLSRSGVWILELIPPSLILVLTLNFLTDFFFLDLGLDFELVSPLKKHGSQILNLFTISFPKFGVGF